MRWTDEAHDRIATVLAQSNIYNCLHGAYGEVGAFGMGAVILESDPEHVVIGRLLTAGEYFVAFDANQVLNAFGRVFWMTAGQMRETFGEDKLSDKVKNALEG
jgi:hypothetical protein